jgi:8-oxo-dGTP pyrophosphatase MutT (NUDIX family)
LSDGTLRCACLLVERDGRILLARVRDNAHWYLPGGTIEPGETPEGALVREIGEELGVALDPGSILLDRKVTGPAYGREGLVELHCFTACWDGELTAQAEVSELGWFGPEDRERVAPAIQMLFDEYWMEPS